MLVYANHLRFEGTDAERAVLKGVGGWLKEQLGFGLHPDQLRQDGEFTGYRGDSLRGGRASILDVRRLRF